MTTKPTPEAMTAARELVAKLSTSRGRRLDEKTKGRMLLACCAAHGVSVSDLALALDQLGAEERAAARQGRGGKR